MKELNRIHLNGLRAVEAVHRLGSLQAAAEELGVSPGAVSQHVIRTEAQLERQLFERRPKGLVAIDTALPALERMHEGFQMLASAAAMAKRRDENVLTVSVAPIFASRWLVHRLSGFALKHPDIRLRMDAALNIVPLSPADIEAAIRVGRGKWPETDAEFLLREEIFPVCTPALAEQLRQPSDLKTLPIIVDENFFVEAWEMWTTAAGVELSDLTVGSTFSDSSLCLDAALGGQGVALVWDSLAEFSLKHGQLVKPFDIRVPTGRSLYFVTPKGHRLSRAAKAFRTWLRSELGLDD